MRLAKKTSNLFRPRAASDAPGLDVSGLGGVISIDSEAQTADVQGMCTYEHLVDATLPHGFIPYVVPQLRTITLGGAVSGLGIESTSFRSGLPHESVTEMDIFTGAGEVVTTTPGESLFDTFPNSYGSLGYATRLRIKLEKVPSYVSLRHVRFDDAGLLSKTIAQIMETKEYDGVRVDGLDGTAFQPGEYYLTLAEWTDQAPTPPSDYTGRQIYYRSIQELSTSGVGHDLLTIYDYLWRWDTDWFWCSRAFGAQHPLARRLWPRRYKRSDVYYRMVALDHRLHVGAWLDRRKGNPEGERVVQDVEIPVERLAEFLDWFDAEVGMRPVWLCPLSPGQKWPTYPLAPGRDLRQRRLLGQRRVGPDAPNASAQPRDRGEGARARRAQVALLRGVLRPRDVRPAVRRRQPGAREGPVRPGPPTDQPLRQGGEETMTMMQIADAFTQLIQGRCPCASRRTTAARAGPRTRRSASS